MTVAAQTLSNPGALGLPPQRASRLRAYAGFVKLEHSIFSLPLIVAGAVLHLRRWPEARLLGLIVAAAAAGRVVAMGLNRIIDAQIDARNPRTRSRELPRGAMARAEAWGIVVIAGAVYAASAGAIAPVCLWLSPIPVALFAAYPYLKRFTSLAHVGLGLAWSMAPLGGWVAASRSPAHVGEAGWLWVFSVLWVAGFDVIYATMDEAFDRQAGLHSLPAALGKCRALRAAAALHALAVLALVMLWSRQLHGAAPLWWLGGIGAVFVWQHALAPRRPDIAFFHLNAAVGFLVLGFIASGI